MTPNKSDQDIQDRLIQAYDRMMEQAKKALEQTREGHVPSLQELLDTARDKSVELGELTMEEAQKVSDYLKRDLEDAARNWQENQRQLSEWLHFDMQLVEDKLRDIFALMVDHTQQTLDRFAKQANAVGWHTGEIVGPGTLTCNACGEELHFHKTGRIPPCPKCAQTAFKRVPE